MKKKMISLLLLIALLGILFISSGQTYEQQSLVPTLQKWLPHQPLENLLATLKIPYWGIIVSVEERGYYYFLEFLIRKSAHFFTFAFIATTMYIALPKKYPRAIIAAVCSLIIAILDEYHQSLTGGRTPLAADVGIDFAGVCSALLIASFVNYLRDKRRHSISR